eukprot:UN07000
MKSKKTKSNQEPRPKKESNVKQKKPTIKPKNFRRRGLQNGNQWTESAGGSELESKLIGR